MKAWNKILRLCMLSCLAICCTFCSDEESMTDKQPVVVSSTFLSLQLSISDNISFTRSVDDLQGTVGERKVSSVHLLLYDVGGSASRLIYNFKIDARTDGVNKFSGQDVVDRGSVSALSNQFVSEGKPVVSQDYQLVVLVNATPQILAKAKAETDYPTSYSTLSDLLEIVDDTNPDEYCNSGHENHFMSNAGGVIFIPKSSLGSNKEKAEDSPIPVPLERLLAKVLVYENKNYPLQNVALGGKIGAVTWGLDNTNKKTNLIRALNKLKNGIVENGFEADRSQVYANDPNFENNVTIAADPLLYAQHFNKLDVSDYNAFIPWNISGQNASNYQYVLENTFSVEDQKLDVTPKKYITQVLLKVIITEPNGLAGITDYYSYYNGNAWKVFTHKQAVEWFAGGVVANQSFPDDMTGLSAVITLANNRPEFDFTIETGVPSKYINTDLGLTFHAGGLNIYCVPIKHFGAQDITMNEDDYGYYGVVRNNTYRIIINSINGPGTMTEYENLSADITINEWYHRVSDEDLKPVL